MTEPSLAPTIGAAMRLPVLLALAMLVPALAASVASEGPGALLDFPCDQPTAGIPCNLRMTFAPNRGNENYIAISPANPDHIVATSKDYGLTGQPGVQACSVNNVWTGWYSSRDGGKTWANGYARGHPGSGTTPISKYKCSTDAVVAVDNAGTFFLSGLAYNSTGATSAIWVAKSTDGGLTWTDPHIGDESNFDDKNWLAVDPSNSDVFITWTHFTTNSGIWLRRALNGDLTQWGPKTKLSGASSGSAQGSFGAVAPNGTLYVIWNDNILGGTGNLYIVSSTDRGATFTPERAAFSYNGAPWNGDTPYRTPNIPALAIDRSTGPFRGTLYVTYQGQANGDADSFLRYSRDGGATWSGEIRLNDDAVGNDKGQNFATVAVDPSNGWVHAVWYDRRDDPNNRAHHTYYAVSKDGGVTWSKNQRVSTHLSAPDQCRHQDGSVFIGDYLGLAAAGGKARPAFVDTRNGRCDLYTALLYAGPRLLGTADRYARVNESLTVDVRASAFTPLTTGQLELDLPATWAVTDADGGTIVPSGPVQTVRWDLGAVTGDAPRRVTAVPAQASIVDLKARLDWSLSAETTASGREAWNTTVYVSYPELQLNLVLPARATAGSAISANVTVLNLGSGAALEGTLDLALPPGLVALPRGVGFDPESGGLGLAYGSPSGDPAMLGSNVLRWTIPTIAPGTNTLYRVVLLVLPSAPGQPISMPFTASLGASGPDGAPLGATETEVTRYASASVQPTLATPGAVLAYLTEG